MKIKDIIQEELDGFIKELTPEEDDDGFVDQFEPDEFEQGYMRGLEVAINALECKKVDTIEKKARAYDDIKERYADFDPSHNIIK